MSLQTYVSSEGTRPLFSTSASGSMAGAPAMARVLLRGPLYIEGTAARRLLTDEWENVLVPLPQTSAGRTYVGEAEDPQSTSSAIMELRRLSGLTWEQLATLFGVARRSLHFWASGKPVSAPNEERLRRLLAAVRKADRGFAAKNRAMLLEDRDGVVPFDLLARGELDTFLELVGAGPGRRELKLTPLSPEAQAGRRPQPPEELVGALQDRVHVDVGRVRPGRAVKIKK
jgi:transcriptional regulator with XRE-family HTH domain